MVISRGRLGTQREHADTRCCPAVLRTEECFTVLVAPSNRRDRGCPTLPPPPWAPIPVPFVISLCNAAPISCPGDSTPPRGLKPGAGTQGKAMAAKFLLIDSLPFSLLYSVRALRASEEECTGILDLYKLSSVPLDRFNEAERDEGDLNRSK